MVKNTLKEVNKLMKQFVSVLRKKHKYKGTTKANDIIKFGNKQSSSVSKRITRISEEFMDMILYDPKKVSSKQLNFVKKEIFKLANNN